jgi:DNA-binding IclR family transcriptional regulator
MSTSPETSERVDDRLVSVISRWLARHLPDDELRRELAAVEPGQLEPEQAEAIEELRFELRETRQRAELEMVARETLEALALGG